MSVKMLRDDSKPNKGTSQYAIDMLLNNEKIKNPSICPKDDQVGCIFTIKIESSWKLLKIVLCEYKWMSQLIAVLAWFFMFKFYISTQKPGSKNFRYLSSSQAREIHPFWVWPLDTHSFLMETVYIPSLPSEKLQYFWQNCRLRFSTALSFWPHLSGRGKRKHTHFCSFSIVRSDRPFLIEGHSVRWREQRSFHEFAVKYQLLWAH